MRLSVKIAFSLVLLGSSVAALAEVPRADVRAMMERSGLVAQLADEGKRMRETLPQMAAGQLPADLIPPFAELVERVWDSQGLLDAVEAAYADLLTPEDLRAINAFLDTPLSKRLVEAETAASTTAASDEIEKRNDELIAKLDADPDRAAAIERIDKTLRVTDVTVTIAMSVSKATILGLAADLDPEMVELLDESIEVMRPVVVEDARKSVRAAFAWTYAGFSVEELRAYADFLETDPAKIINGAYFAVASEHYVVVGRKLGEGASALFRQRKT